MSGQQWAGMARELAEQVRKRTRLRVELAEAEQRIAGLEARLAEMLEADRRRAVVAEMAGLEWDDATQNVGRFRGGAPWVKPEAVLAELGRDGDGRTRRLMGPPLTALGAQVDCPGLPVCARSWLHGHYADGQIVDVGSAHDS